MSEITGFTTYFHTSINTVIPLLILTAIGAYFHTSINTVIPLLVLTAIGGGNSRFYVAK